LGSHRIEIKVNTVSVYSINVTDTGAVLSLCPTTDSLSQTSSSLTVAAGDSVEVIWTDNITNL
jgi:hypothetical protein